MTPRALHPAPLPLLLALLALGCATSAGPRPAAGEAPAVGTPPTGSTPPPAPAAVAPPADARSTVVLLVRHAEKASGGADPALTAEGQKRAESLLRVAAEAGVTAIYATPFQRTRSTARPLSEKLGVPVTTVELGAAGVEAHAQALAQEVLTRQKGQVVLVVGHSNTIPAIAAALTGKQVEPMPETEYDRLLVAVVPAVGEPGLVRARY